MAGGGAARTAKTAIVRTVVPRAYRDVAAGLQLYGKALDAQERGHAEVAGRMKQKAGNWMQGNRIEGGRGGNFSGMNSARGAPRGWPPQSVQTAEDVAGAVSRNVAGVTNLAQRSLAATVLADMGAAAPRALAVAARLSVPTAMIATGAAFGTAAWTGGKEAFDKGGDALDIAKGAGWGVLNSATVGVAADIHQTGSIAAGLQKWADDAKTSVLKTFGMSGGQPDGKTSPAATPGRPSTGVPKADADKFKSASDKFAARQRQAASEKPPPVNGPRGNGKRGFQISSVQAAAQAAQGHVYSGGDDD